METITIPSPTAFLTSPILQPSSPTLSRKNPPKKVAAANVEKAAAAAAGGATKPKQSKSRNGNPLLSMLSMKATCKPSQLTTDRLCNVQSEAIEV